MRKLISASSVACLALLMFALSAALAEDGYERGRILQNLTMPSAILKKDVQYSVYLPPGFDEDENRTYPFFYLMHGGGNADHFGSTEWIANGGIDYVMNKGIAENTIIPMVVVMTDARRNEKNWPLTMHMNDVDGEYMWADMFVKELIPHVEAKFRMHKQVPRRGIGGLSMGGYGAIYHTFQNLDLFQATVSLSAGLNTPDQIVSFDQDYIERRFAKPYGMSGQAGKDRLNEHYYKHDPNEAVKKMDVNLLKKKLHLYMDVGSQDRRQRANFELHWYLWEQGVDHVYIQRTGEHVWDYWRSGIGDGLNYASKYLRD